MTENSTRCFTIDNYGCKIFKERFPEGVVALHSAVVNGTKNARESKQFKRQQTTPGIETRLLPNRQHEKVYFAMKI